MHLYIDFGDKGKNAKQRQARYFIEFCIFCKVLALSPGILAYKLAHNSYGQYCLTRITWTRYIFPVFPHTLKSWPVSPRTRSVLFALSNHNDK